MNLKNIEFICPICKRGSVNIERNIANCINIKCKSQFSVLDGKPVLIDFNKSVIRKENFIEKSGKSEVPRIDDKFIIKIKRILFGFGSITKKNLEYLEDHFQNKNDLKILIIGGGTIGSGMNNFYKVFKKNILAFDIYVNYNIHFIADAHNIPLKDKSFDFIIIQAVLEHVLNPYKVVDECRRLLKVDGLIYAETPFMQQVHEGAYDFIRFTDSGHRYLFKNFSILKSGPVAGVGTSLLWSISYFFGGLFRSIMVKNIVRVFFFWLRYFDFLIPDSHNIDGASGVYFIGKKSEIVLSEKEIITYYNGSQ
jgi:SAM-dependent methyltransferase